MFFNNFVAQLHSLFNLNIHFFFISFQLINLHINFLPMLVLKLCLYALIIFVHLGLHLCVFDVIGVDGQLGNHGFQFLVFLHYLCNAVPHIISFFLQQLYFDLLLFVVVTFISHACDFCSSSLRLGIEVEVGVGVVGVIGVAVGCKSIWLMLLCF